MQAEVEGRAEALLGAVRSIRALLEGGRAQRVVGLVLVDRRSGIDTGVALTDVKRAVGRIVRLPELHRDHPMVRVGLRHGVVPVGKREGGTAGDRPDDALKVEEEHAVPREEIVLGLTEVRLAGVPHLVRQGFPRARNGIDARQLGWLVRAAPLHHVRVPLEGPGSGVPLGERGRGAHLLNSPCVDLEHRLALGAGRVVAHERPLSQGVLLEPEDEGNCGSATDKRTAGQWSQECLLS